MNLRTTQLLVKETLYDSLGRAAITTVPVCKQNDNDKTNASCTEFISDFITSRDPAQPTSTWLNGGVLSGAMTNWVDNESFCLANDVDYAYTGRYFETDPASRVVQSNLPGVTFQKSSDFVQPNHSISYYQNYLPAQLAQADLLPNAVKNPQVITQYQVAAQQTSLGNLGDITQANWQDFLGRPQAKAVVDTNNQCLVTSYSYQTGAQLSTGISESAATQTPIMNLQKVFLPNSFSSTVESASSFYLQNQINALGQVVQNSSPDMVGSNPDTVGSNVYFYDNYNRLCFSQTADQENAGVVAYYLYDALNRCTEVGLYPASWDISAFQQQTQTSSPVTTQPAGAIPQKKITYDGLSGAPYNPTAQGQVVQIATTGLTAGNSAIQVANNPFMEIYSYDSWGRTIAVTALLAGSGAPATRYTYSGLGLITSIQYLDGFSVFYTYNQQGLLNGINYATTATQTIPYGLATYVYNVSGQVVTETVADTRFDDAEPITTTFSYGNSLSQLTAITIVDASSNLLFAESLCYTDDSDGDNTQGNYQDGNIQRISYQYPQEIGADGNFTMTYSYDTFGRLQGATSDVNSEQLDLSEASYDDNGNYLNLNASFSQQYTYPGGCDFVQTITLNNGPGYISYTYSNNGLITGFTFNNIGSSQYPLSFSYDAITALPLTTDLSTSSSSTIQQQLIYDSRGERFRKILSGANIDYQITYIRGLGANCLMEFNSVNAPILHYIYGPLGLVAMHYPIQSITFINFRDHLGSSCVVYNPQSGGKVAAYKIYDCFGMVRFAEADVNFNNPKELNYLFHYAYTGQEWDFETQLYNYHARLYDPLLLRRFLQPDPAHQFASPYVYVGNNPINATDPTGRTLASIVEVNARPLANFDGNLRNKWNILDPAQGPVAAGFYGGHLSQVTIDPRSELMFRYSNENVAFVGAYRFSENKIFLHPLVPWPEHYDTKPFEPPLLASFLPGYPDAAFREPILHDSHLGTSHLQIVERYFPNEGNRFSGGPKLDDFIGFRIIKNSPSHPANGENQHVYSGQSNTLNKIEEPGLRPNSHAQSPKFTYAGVNNVGGDDAYLPREWNSFIKDSLRRRMPREFK